METDINKFKERFDALSDAILAIAMTILVLEIKAPVSASGMEEFIKSIGLFIISFFVIFNFWYERTQNYLEVESINEEILGIDILSHLAICLIPLATKSMISYENQTLSVFIYGLLNLFIGWSTDIIRHRLVHYRLIDVPEDAREGVVRAMVEFGRRGTILRLVLLILACIFPHIFVYAYLIAPLSRFWARYRAGKRRVQEGRESRTIINLFIQMGQNVPDDLRGRQPKRRALKARKPR